MEKDTLYNPSKAKKKSLPKPRQICKLKELNLIHLNLPTSSTYTDGIKQAQSFKQSVESTLGAENIVIDLNMISEDDLQRVTYFAESASQQDWDLNNNLGWGPDYTDPSSYIDITSGKIRRKRQFLLWIRSGTVMQPQNGWFDEYDQLIEEAHNETKDVNKRYEKYAAAQAVDR